MNASTSTGWLLTRTPSYLDNQRFWLGRARTCGCLCAGSSRSRSARFGPLGRRRRRRCCWHYDPKRDLIERDMASDIMSGLTRAGSCGSSSGSSSTCALRDGARYDGIAVELCLLTRATARTAQQGNECYM